MNKRTDQIVIIKALKESREEGLRFLFDEYSDTIYNIAYHVLKDQFESEDVVQEVFMKVWNARHNLDMTGSLGAFIHVVTTRLSLNKLRDLQLKIKEQHAMLSMGMLEGKSLDYHIQVTEINTLEQEALEQLPEQQKKAYLLSRKEGLTYKEIAEQMDISPNTVKNHLIQALKTFRKHFQKFGYPLFLFFLNFN